jgi:hypothetical protein
VRKKPCSQIKVRMLKEEVSSARQSCQPSRANLLALYCVALH